MPSSTPAASAAYTRRAVTRSTAPGSARRSPAIHSANATQTGATPTSPRLPARFVQRIDSATHLRRTRPPHRSGRRDLVGAGPADLRLRPRLSARVPDAGGVGADRSARRRRNPREPGVDADRDRRGVRPSGPHPTAPVEGGGMTVTAGEAAEITDRVDAAVAGLDPDAGVGSWSMSAASAERVTVQSRRPERGPDQCCEDEGQGQRHLALLAGTTSTTRPTTASCKGSSITINNRWPLDAGQLIARPARRW